MKRIVFLTALVLLPIAGFAQFQVGLAGFYNPLLSGADLQGGFDLSDISVAAEFRATRQALQTGFLAGFTPGSPEIAQGTIDVIADLGIVLDLTILKIGIGAGPDIRWDLSQSGQAFGHGANLKLTVDFAVGAMGLGVTALARTEFDFSGAESPLDRTSGWVGISVLLNLAALSADPPGATE